MAGSGLKPKRKVQRCEFKSHRIHDVLNEVENMDWHYSSAWEAFYMSGDLDKVIAGIGVIVFIGAVIYFIDGVKKYGYWRDEKKNDSK